MTLEELSQLLYDACMTRRACRIHLFGEPLSRLVHPYGICRTSGNKVVLVAWQSMGFTKAGGREGFRNLILTDIDSCEVTDQHSSIHPDFNPKDGQYYEWVFHA